MKYAFKTQDQNPNRIVGTRAKDQWIVVEILDDEKITYEDSGYIVLNDKNLQKYFDTLVAPNAIQEYNLSKTISNRRAYCEDLIERMKKENIKSNITIQQAFWAHTRLRKFSFTMSGQEFILDLMNLVVSGDVEVACISLNYFIPDDMTMPFHWFTQARISWLQTDMKKYLGWPL